MSVEDRVIALIDEGNPIPDPNDLDRVRVDAATYLATIEQRSSEVTQLETKNETPETARKRKWALGLATAVVVALVATVVLLQQNEAEVADAPVNPTEGVSSVEATLIQYADTLNSGNIGEVMSMYWQDGSAKRHPFDTVGAGSGNLWIPSEIRPAEEAAIAAKGSGAGVEFLDIQVDEEAPEFGPNVTFSWRFYYGADGEGSGGEAGCIGGKNANARILANKIKALDWGFDDPSACNG